MKPNFRGVKICELLSISFYNTRSECLAFSWLVQLLSILLTTAPTEIPGFKPSSPRIPSHLSSSYSSSNVHHNHTTWTVQNEGASINWLYVKVWNAARLKKRRVPQLLLSIPRGERFGLGSEILNIRQSKAQRSYLLALTEIHGWISSHEPSLDEYNEVHTK